MLRKIAVLLLAAGVAFAVKTPRALSDVPISMTDGKTVNLKQYRGKVVLLLLISTTCADCITAIDMVNRLQQNFGPRGFQGFAVAVGREADSKSTKGFIERYRPAFPMGFVEEKPFRQLADIGPTDRPYVPIFIFIDKKGTVRFEYTAIDAIMEKSQRSKNSGSIIEGLLRQQE